MCMFKLKLILYYFWVWLCYLIFTFFLCADETTFLTAILIWNSHTVFSEDSMKSKCCYLGYDFTDDPISKCQNVACFLEFYSPCDEEGCKAGDFSYCQAHTIHPHKVAAVASSNAASKSTQMKVLAKGTRVLVLWGRGNLFI